MTVTSQVEASSREPDRVPDAGLEIDCLALLLSQLGSKTSEGDRLASLQPPRALVVENPRLIAGSAQQRCPAGEAASHDLDRVSIPLQDTPAADDQHATVPERQRLVLATGDRDGPAESTDIKVRPDDARRCRQQQLSVWVDGHAVKDSLARLGAVQHHLGLDAGRRLNDHRGLIGWAACREPRQRRGVVW